MDANGIVIIKKSDRRIGSVCIRVGAREDREKLEKSLGELFYLLRYTYPAELTYALLDNLNYTLPWYSNQRKEGLLIPTRSRLVLPEVIKGNGKRPHTF